MANTTARITKNGKKFEILVDLEEALKIKRGEEGADITRTLQTDTIFTNMKAGDRASTNDLEVIFQTNNTEEIAEKIIKQGEVVLTTEHQKEDHTHQKE
jgi:ribosome maturation protein SDO1